MSNQNPYGPPPGRPASPNPYGAPPGSPPGRTPYGSPQQPGQGFGNQPQPQGGFGSPQQPGQGFGNQPQPQGGFGSPPQPGQQPPLGPGMQHRGFQPSPGGPGSPVSKKQNEGDTAAMVGLISGAVGVFLVLIGFIPCIGVVSYFSPLAALVAFGAGGYALLGKQKTNNKPFAIGALVLGGVIVLYWIVWVFIVGAFFAFAALGS